MRRLGQEYTRYQLLTKIRLDGIDSRRLHRLFVNKARASFFGGRHVPFPVRPFHRDLPYRQIDVPPLRRLPVAPQDTRCPQGTVRLRLNRVYATKPWNDAHCSSVY